MTQRQPAADSRVSDAARIMAGSASALREAAIPYSPTLMDALPAAVYTTDADGRVTHFNRAAVELSGRVPELGTDRWCVTWKLYWPDGRPLPFDECPMAVALKEGRSIAGAEAVAERPDGSRVWFAAYPTPLYDGSDRLIGGVNMLVDITARKAVELSVTRSAREQGALYRFTDRLQRTGSIDEIHAAAMEAILDGTACDRAAILVIADDGIMRFAASKGLSATYRRAVGGHTPWRLDDPDPQPIGIPDVAASDLDDSLKSTIEREGIAAVGFVPLVSHGRLVGKFMVYYDAPREFEPEDFGLALTIARQLALAIDRRGIEEDRRNRARDLAFLAALSERIRLATDGESLLYEVSCAIGGHLGVSRSFFVRIDEQNDRGVIQRDYCRDVASVAGEHSISRYSEEARRQLVAGQTVVVRDGRADGRGPAAHDAAGGLGAEVTYVAVPLHRDGHWEGAFLVSADEPRAWEPREVTLIETSAERAWNAAEKLRLDAALREADRRKDEFLATLAHELRNPLGPIRSALPLIESNGTNGEDPSRWLEIVNRQTDRLSRLVDDLIDVSRITRGHIELRPEIVDVAALVESALEAVGEELEANDLTLETSLTPAATVRGDPFRLEQVVSNLLANAIKYTDAGGTISVSVAIDDDGGTVQVAVADTGIGIEPQYLSQVFTLFEQADRSLDRSKGGLGIGLTLARRLVELHGGTVEARSGGGGLGSTFTMTLPYEAGRVEAAGARASAPARAADAQRPRRRVLIVDDNEDYADVVRELVTHLGHEAHVASDGIQGARMAEELHPDVVLLDIGLPGMSGYELGRRLRQSPATADAMLVAVSGYAQPADRAQSARAGLDAHMIKPIELRVLEDLLNEPGDEAEPAAH